MQKYIIGIDEAGRGPIAGPVAVGGVCVPFVKYLQVKKRCISIRGKDSKKLTEKERRKWFEKIKQMQREGLLQYSVTMTGSLQIDKKGIVPSIQIAMNRVLKSVCEASPSMCKIKLDGSLYAPDIYVNQETIIKGDEKEFVISLASICAKVVRDNKMKKLDIKYPVYGFAQHKGYGTKAHYKAISKNGICNEHRKSFLKE